VLIGIYEDDDDWQLASGIDQVASFDALPSQESPDGVQGAGGKNIFLMQIVQTAKVHRLAMPLVCLVQIDGDLHCHVAWHFTSPAGHFFPQNPVKFNIEKFAPLENVLAHTTFMSHADLSQDLARTQVVFEMHGKDPLKFELLKSVANQRLCCFCRIPLSPIGNANPVA